MRAEKTLHDETIWVVFRTIGISAVSPIAWRLTKADALAFIDALKNEYPYLLLTALPVTNGMLEVGAEDIARTGDNAKIHGKIFGFLVSECARKADRQLVGVDLLYMPGNGYRLEMLRSWERTDEPQLFATFINLEKLSAHIVEIAEREANAPSMTGRHRFGVSARQHSGGRSSMSFALNPRSGRSPIVSEQAPPPRCDGSYVDFQGAERRCLQGGEGCGSTGCPAAHGPQGGW